MQFFNNIKIHNNSFYNCASIQREPRVHTRDFVNLCVSDRSVYRPSRLMPVPYERIAGPHFESLSVTAAGTPF